VKKFNPDEPLRCSFCHKDTGTGREADQFPVDYPRAYICNECVGVCQTILEDEKREQAAGPAKRLPPPTGDQAIPGRLRDRAGPHEEKTRVAVYNTNKRIFLNKQPGDIELSKSKSF